MKGNANKLLSLIAAVLLLCSLTVTAYAHEAVDLDRLGSITISVQYNGKPISGAKFTCVRMAYVQEIKGTESGFHFYRLFDNVMIEDDRVSADAANLAKELETIYKDNRDRFDFQEWTLQTDKEGKVTFHSLEPGLYLLRQPSATPGYYKMSPFLVSLPYVVKDSDGGWHYEYDVSVNAKSELEKEPTPTTPDPDDKLPQTGQLWWPVPVLAVAGMAVFALGWTLFKGKRKEHEG